MSLVSIGLALAIPLVVLALAFGNLRRLYNKLRTDEPKLKLQPMVDRIVRPFRADKDKCQDLEMASLPKA